MKYQASARRSREPKKRNRLLTTLFYLCLPIIAATFFSGSFFKLGTLQPGEMLDARPAAAASSGHNGHASSGVKSTTRIPSGSTVVHMTGKGFSSALVNVRRGTIVAWVNDVATPQSVQVTSPVAFGSMPLATGEVFAYKFDNEGSYPFKSGAYSGLIVVGGGPETTGTPGGGGCIVTGNAGISILSNGFQPTPLTVAAGTRVTWTNNSGDRARIRDVNHNLFDSDDLDPGQTFSYVFCFGGTIHYENTRNETTGTVIVTGGTGTPVTTGTAQTTGTPGGTGTPQVTTTPIPGNIVDVQIIDEEFVPANITVNSGTTVRWTNNDDDEHTVTSPGNFDSGDMELGDVFQFTFIVNGNYDYFCAYHDDMLGRVTVIGGPTATPQPTSPPVPGNAEVNIQAFAFQPANVTILVGSSVTWTNLDAAPHTATADNGAFNSGTLNQGQSFTFTFNTPGTFTYFCAIHPAMRGTITVVTSLPSVTATPATTNTPTPATTGTPGATTTSVPGLIEATIQNYVYNPLTITVQTGTTVRWTNLDADQHSVTEVGGLFDSGLFGQNGQWQYTFNAPGTYEYYCTLHGTYMTGWVIVQGSPTTATPGTTTTPGSTVTAGTTTTPGSTVTAGTTTTPGSTGTPGSTVTAGTTGTPQATTTPGTCAIEFVDVQPGSTFYTFVQCLACRNVLGGYADGTFRPNNGVTRGQLSKIVSNAAGWTENPTTQSFEDVPAGHTFYTFVERMASRGIIGGYVCGSDGEPCGAENRPYFRPNNPATRGQITKIVSESRGYNDPVSGQSFEDVAPGSTFHLWVERLATRGIMSGYACGGVGEPCGEGSRPYFRPGNNATRGQLAKIVSNSFFPECQP